MLNGRSYVRRITQSEPFRLDVITTQTSTISGAQTLTLPYNEIDNPEPNPEWNARRVPLATHSMLGVAMAIGRERFSLDRSLGIRINCGRATVLVGTLDFGILC